MHVFLAAVAEGAVLVVAVALLFVSFESRTADRGSHRSPESGFNDRARTDIGLDEEQPRVAQSRRPRRIASRSAQCHSVPANSGDTEASVALPRATELTFG